MQILTWRGFEFGNFILIAAIRHWKVYVVIAFRVWFRNLANDSFSTNYKTCLGIFKTYFIISLRLALLKVHE